MSRSTSFALITAPALFLASGCEGLPLLSDPWGGHLEATVSGADSLTYSGVAVFTLFRYPGDDHDQFHLSSHGTGASSGDWLGIERDGGRPPRGVYPVGLRSNQERFRAGFNFESEEHSDAYAVSEGHLVVTHSSSNHLVGAFDLTAVRYCRRVKQGGSDSGEGSCNRFYPDPDAPRARISGTFDVPRVRNEVEGVINDSRSDARR